MRCEKIKEMSFSSDKNIGATSTTKAKTLNPGPTSRPPTPIVAGMGVDDAAMHCGMRVL